MREVNQLDFKRFMAELILLSIIGEIRRLKKLFWKKNLYNSKNVKKNCEKFLMDLGNVGGVCW